MAEQLYRKQQVLGSSPNLGSMARQYSRLARVEENQNKRQIIIFGGLSVALLVFLAFFGIPLIAKLSGAISNLKNGDKTTQQTNNNPIPAPQLNTLPEFVNKPDLEISGSAQPDTQIVISINNTKRETTSNSNGTFSVNTNLVKGENEIYAVAVKDNASSNETRHVKVIYDNEAPKFELTRPTDGATFFGDKQKQLTIEGRTESEAQITVNDRLVIIDSSGNFRHVYNLSEGQNTLNFVILDRAGNKKETSVTVTYNP